ncbi:hypothetical protein [Curtobacterium sp. VKM Ac-1376]|uniref:hypothetical protein n=1 Tax=Curtobacterium sp. VKM Ac-1376 TaxID=123312 RepID=UPI00188CF98A|nr:hypothetical protein [Curtobacterium sp. VKM Ac-1376]MBF4613774.1 hypothetical protein [Curtobacterium sp. VKM Ac-1376]
MTIGTAGLRSATSFPITVRRATVTKVTPTVHGGEVIRWVGEIQIYPDSRRIEIIVGLGATDGEWVACDAWRVLLPRTLPYDLPSEGRESQHSRTGERMWRTALYVDAPDPLIELELQMLLDNPSEVNA